MRLPNAERLDATWESFEQAVSSIGSLIRSDPLNRDPLRRYEAYKTALAMIAENYVNQVYPDRSNPECLPSFGSLFNHAGPAQDFYYHTIHIEPGTSYHVWGRRGDAALIDIQQSVGWFGHNEEEISVVTLANDSLDSNLQCDEDGRFEFTLGCERQTGQWLRLDPRTDTILIREYFTDYAAQQRRSEFHFDKRIPDYGGARDDLGQAIVKLKHFAHSLKDYQLFFRTAAAFAHNNRFEEIDTGNTGTVQDQRYFHARFDVKPTDALIGEWTAPESFQYWGIALYNDTLQELNFATHQVNLNHALAKVGKDRKFFFVLSHVDTGVANWLDVDGHEKGVVVMRTKGASHFELPQLKCVPLDELDRHLSADVNRTNEVQRKTDMAIRRRHFQIREGR